MAAVADEVDAGVAVTIQAADSLEADAAPITIPTTTQTAGAAAAVVVDAVAAAAEAVAEATKLPPPASL